MAFTMINEQSTLEHILELLEQSNLGALIDGFKENQVDGEDFFGLEMSDLTTMIPVLKLRKKFISVWSKVTGLTFDSNGVRVPMKMCQDKVTYPVEPRVEVTPTVRKSPRKRHASTTIPSSNCKRSLISSISPFQASKPSMYPTLSPANSDKSGYTSSPSTSKESNAAIPSNTANWIQSFCIPTRWELSVEAGLKDGKLTAEGKSAMTRQLCTIILSNTSSASQAEIDHVAISLIKKYPFLSGSFGSGHQYWSKKIKERLLNLKRKVSRDERKKFQEQGVKMPKGKPAAKEKTSSKNNMLLCH